MDWLREDGRYWTFADEVVAYIGAIKESNFADFELGGQVFKYIGLLSEEGIDGWPLLRFDTQCRVEGCSEEFDVRLDLAEQKAKPGFHLTCAYHMEVEPPAGAWTFGAKLEEREWEAFHEWQVSRMALGLTVPRRRHFATVAEATAARLASQTQTPAMKIGSIEKVVLGVLSDLAVLGTVPTADMVITASKPKLTRPKGRDVRRRMARDALQSLERKGLAQVVW